MANITKATLVAIFARRIPDPSFKNTCNLERHLFVVPVRQIPKDLPLDPNARRPKTNRRVYQKVRDSLFNVDCEPGTFHLKNNGITIIAEKVVPLGNNRFEIHMLNGVHGIVDGGHTHEIIGKAQDDPDLPNDQFVNVEVRVGVPQNWIADIAGGLNTSVQVQDMSLDHLSGLFDWIKREIKQEPYYNQIAWSENDPGEFDARDLVSLMTMFNIEIHPNDDDEHPVYAYEKKSTALKQYETKIGSYERMRSMLKDILKFHDIVRRDYREIWNNQMGGNKRAGALSFSEGKKKGVWAFPFTGQSSEYRMVNGALYPILAAFRWHVEMDPVTLKMQWRDGFDAILRAWDDCAVPLLKATHEMSNSLGHNPQSVGKSRPHWSNLHNLVAKRDLQRRAAENS